MYDCFFVSLYEGGGFFVRGSVGFIVDGIFYMIDVDFKGKVFECLSV